MKSKFISIVILLILMALLPLLIVKCTISEERSHASATADSTQAVGIKDIICGAVAAQADKELCDEAMKALVIILNSNYKADNNSIDLTDNCQYIDFNSIYNSDKELYTKISTIYNSVSEIYVTYEGSVVAVPYSYSSNGTTLTDDSKPYVISVASVWDCFSNGYSSDLSCYGVSINGINYLCKNGSDYKEALLWYLPLCSISS